jgi:hypothetical protein
MNLQLLTDNLTNPALLFFILGVLAVQLNSDLEIPKSSARFISIYLLFAIGFKGGQELSHSSFSMDIFWVVIFCVVSTLLIPIYSFFILKKKLSIDNSVAIAAAYGSVSAVTFVTAISFLEIQGMAYNGHMVAMLALMEAPAIIVAVILLKYYSSKNEETSIGKIIKHSLTNGSVFLVIGSLIIGFLASEKQALEIRPFTNDIFKGFLAVFLLDKGIESGKNLKGFFSNGLFTTGFAILIPFINGVVVAWATQYFISDISDRFMIAVLAASASYIAVPAAMKITVPKANPGLYIPMALAITFPFNITLGMPLYLMIINTFK